MPCISGASVACSKSWLQLRERDRVVDLLDAHLSCPCSFHIVHGVTPQRILQRLQCTRSAVRLRVSGKFVDKTLTVLQQDGEWQERVPMAAGARARKSRMRMLVVDDEVEIADMLAEYFRMEGYDVATANDGAAALEASFNVSGVAMGAFDIILLDVNMPNMDGFEVCRAHSRAPELPHHLPHGARWGRRPDRRLSAGADDYVLKPFSLRCSAVASPRTRW